MFVKAQLGFVSETQSWSEIKDQSWGPDFTLNNLSVYVYH